MNHEDFRQKVWRNSDVTNIWDNRVGRIVGYGIRTWCHSAMEKNRVTVTFSCWNIFNSCPYKKFLFARRAGKESETWCNFRWRQICARSRNRNLKRVNHLKQGRRSYIHAYLTRCSHKLRLFAWLQRQGKYLIDSSITRTLSTKAIVTDRSSDRFVQC